MGRVIQDRINLFGYGENFHGTCFGTDPTGNTFAGDIAANHYAKRTDADTFAAAGAQLFVNNIHALCVLRNSAGFAGFGTLAALDTDLRFHHAIFLDDLNAGFILIKHLVKRLGTCSYASQTCLAIHVFFYSQLFHAKNSLSQNFFFSRGIVIFITFFFRIPESDILFKSILAKTYQRMRSIDAFFRVKI